MYHFLSAAVRKPLTGLYHGERCESYTLTQEFTFTVYLCVNGVAVPTYILLDVIMYAYHFLSAAVRKPPTGCTTGKGVKLHSDPRVRVSGLFGCEWRSDFLVHLELGL